ncbi:MAG TPA: hypothetical protein VIF14_18015 [Alphaproteobacteria bacterium]|jgi:hypothetical protein
MRLIRFLFGLLGLAAFLVAALAVAAEVKSLVDAGALFAKPFGKIWFDVHKDSLLLLQPAIERYLHPWLWGGVVQPLLERPPLAAAGAFAALGLALVLIGRLFRGRR